MTITTTMAIARAGNIIKPTPTDTPPPPHTTGTRKIVRLGHLAKGASDERITEGLHKQDKPLKYCMEYGDFCPGTDCRGGKAVNIFALAIILTLPQRKVTKAYTRR